MMVRRPTGHHDEDGAVAITTALLLVALVMMAALIVDIGFLRIDHRDNQTVADMAVAAGGLALGGDIDRVAACEEAWDYLVNNLEEVPDTTSEPSPDCAAVFSGDCDPAVRDEMVASLAGGDIDVVIRMPVFDGDDAMQPSRQAIEADRDGTPCERISVELRQYRQHRFAVVQGFTDGSSISGAVARRTDEGSEERFVSLIVLDRSGCSTIKSSGGGSSIEVQSFTDADGTVHPGTITTDSVPTSGCGPNNKVFDVDSGHISAEGDIFSYGYRELGSPDDIYDDPPPALDPSPRPGPIIRRTSIDHRYNCQTGGYGSGPEPFLPESSSLSPTFRQDGVPPCEEGNPSYIRGLYGYVAEQFDLVDLDGDGVIDETVDDGDAPAVEFAADGFRVYPDAGESCGDVNIPDGVGDDDTRWFFDCDSTEVKGGSTLSLPDAELVVFRGDLDARGDVTINVNSAVTTPGPSDASMVLWDGEMSVPGKVTTRKTFIYLTNVDEGRLTTEGSGGIDLEAPEGPQDPDCNTGGQWPTAECFEDLAIWQGGEGTGPQDEMGLAGSGQLRVFGTVFAPNTLINIGGGGATDLEDAQFFGWQFWYHGGGVLTLIPNPEAATPQQLFGSGLIR